MPLPVTRLTCAFYQEFEWAIVCNNMGFDDETELAEFVAADKAFKKATEVQMAAAEKLANAQGQPAIDKATEVPTW